MDLLAVRRMVLMEFSPIKEGCWLQRFVVTPVRKPVLCEGCHEVEAPALTVKHTEYHLRQCRAAKIAISAKSAEF